MAYGTLIGGAVNAAVKVSPAWVLACGQAAPIVSSGVFLSPIPTVQNIMREKTVGSLPLLPYSSMCVNAFMWMTYGILKKDSKVWAPNFFGLVCGLNYFYQFQKHCLKSATNLPGTVSQHFNYSALFIAFTTLSAITLNTQLAATLIGRVAVVICIILFSSPLAALRTVVETRNAKSIPLPFTLTCILNCFLWTVYGFDLGDFNIYFPNLLGLMSSVVQLGLILFYGNGNPAKELPL